MKCAEETEWRELCGRCKIIARKKQMSEVRGKNRMERRECTEVRGRNSMGGRDSAQAQKCAEETEWSEGARKNKCAEEIDE